MGVGIGVYRGQGGMGDLENGSGLDTVHLLGGGLGLGEELLSLKSSNTAGA